MNQRERYLETLLFGTPDRIPLEPQSGRISTREAWHTQGLPKNILPEKIPEYDFEMIGKLERLKAFGKPILIAISRKSFIGEVVNKPPAGRLVGSLAATAIAVYNGAHIIRTHDVADTVDAIQVAESIKNTMDMTHNKYPLQTRGQK